MLCLPGLDSKSYWERLPAGPALPEIPCPNPSCLGCRLRGHGWYRRYLDGDLVKIRRTQCPRCGVTHALLPEDVCAYQDLKLPALELAMEAAGPTAAARATGCLGGAVVRRARRWRRGRTWRLLAFLLPVAGEPLERIVALVGEASGKLIRLRRWLWSKLGYFLGGPSGVLRHGRPARAGRGRST